MAEKLLRPDGPRRALAASAKVPPAKMNKSQLKNRIIRRLRKMRDELQQTIVDKEWWNENRSDADPFDLGWDRVMLQCVTKQLEAWEVDDIETVNEWNRKMMAVSDRAFG